MAFNYHSGENEPRKTLAPLSATAIEIGDLLATTAGVPVTAADVAWNSTLAATQEDFHDAFFGCSLDRSRVGDTDPVMASTKGKHRFTVAAGSAHQVGELVGPAKQSGNLLENQKVAAVATANLAIGRVAQYASATDTELIVEILATVPHGGSYAAA